MVCGCWPLLLLLFFSFYLFVIFKVVAAHGDGVAATMIVERERKTRRVEKQAVKLEKRTGGLFCV